jgi:hypothetical protein
MADDPKKLDLKDALAGPGVALLPLLLPELLRKAGDDRCRCENCESWKPSDFTMSRTVPQKYGRCGFRLKVDATVFPTGLYTYDDGPPWGRCRYFKETAESVEASKARGEKSLVELAAELREPKPKV